MHSLLLATEADAGHAVNAVFETTTGAIGMAYLIPLIPLVGFAAVLVLAKPLRERAAFIATGASTLTFLLSVMVFLQVQSDPGTHVRPMVDWIDAGPLQVTWSLLVDQLTAVMLLVVTGVGTLVHVYSHGYMHGDPRYERYFAYLNLFLFSMLVLVLGSSFLVLFVGWELVGLSSYLLIGFWFEKREYAAAAKKAFITNRVGDVSFMVAMFMLFAAFGTLDLLPILDHAGELPSNVALAVVLLLMGGAAAKSAQIPLYVWLPDAMAGPTPVSALIHAATMVTAGVYLTVRSSPLLVQSLDGMIVIAWIGAATALLAALIAIRQDDIKKILAYSTVSQLGYMFVGVGTGGFSEGIFHLTTHSFFKGLLFLAAGSVMHAMANEGNVWRMGGLRKVMPITFWTSAVAWLAISGVPPFAGFFSKDQILTTAYENGFTGIWVVGVLVAVLTAFYMTRWFLLIFIGDRRFSSDVHPHESPTSMTFPLLVLGALSLVGGAVLNLTHHGPFYRWLQPAVASTEGLAFAEHGALTEPALIAISVVAALVGIGASWALYGRRDLSAGAIAEPIRGPIAELMQRKFFVDELYEAVLVRFGGWVANGMVWFDTNVIDGLVNGAGAASTATARRVRRVQTGLVRGYLAGMVAGAVILLAVLLVQVR